MLINDIRTHQGMTHAAWLLKKGRWEVSQKRRRNSARIEARSVMKALSRARDWRVANGTESPF